MKAYVDALMDEFNIEGSAASPAKSDLFAVDNFSEPLTEPERKIFH